MPKVLCFGSVNVDDVFVVPHIVLTGETISSSEYTVHPGGKGANQSVALSKAGVETYHAGRIGKDGVWVADLMKTHGVKTDLLNVDDKKPNGRAIIQVSASDNDNAIVLLPGTNHAISIDDADSAVGAFNKGDWVVMQNEINLDAANRVLDVAAKKGMVIVLNPAPCPSDFVKSVSMTNVDVLVLNSSEAASIANQLPTTTTGDSASTSSASSSPSELAGHLLRAVPNLKLVVITLGGDGAVACIRSHSSTTSAAAASSSASTTSTSSSASFAVQSISAPALANCKLVDTTGAGDTFVGFFVASLIKTLTARCGGGGGAASSAAKLQDVLTADVVRQALTMGTTAGGMACETHGAMPSVPLWADVEKRAAQA
ncbi:hypothetical protein HDU87_002032 [Geranomyces variabilis]|uniref:Ribokinase n=1 Tax=Geranomyces variabilis TaxID=109894 RepID=A0AAD5TP81_9FUNG|nr:hypothetical protein HDU87_002032 [Geranomyces variabilis]